MAGAGCRPCSTRRSYTPTPGYLTSVVLGEQTAAEVPHWRTLVLEDCDELVRAGSKERAGQALSRLLNLSNVHGDLLTGEA